MRRSTRTTIALGALALGLLAASARADEAATFPAGGVADALKARVGKTATVILRSGKEYGGTVGEVRDHGVVLRSLAGREFFDALIVLDDIAAVELRNR